MDVHLPELTWALMKKPGRFLCEYETTPNFFGMEGIRAETLMNLMIPSKYGIN